MIPRSGSELINPVAVLERAGIRERMRVADLGCGALGHFVFPAAALVGEKGRVYAVDILKDALEMIERRAKAEHIENVASVWADIDVYRATRIPDGELDLTLLVNNLFLSQNRPALVREIARLTKPGGRAVVVEWKATATPIGPAADRRISSEDAEALFRVPAFSRAEAFDAGPHHYGLILPRTDWREPRV